MEGERDRRRDTAKENPVGQDSAQNEYGEIGEQAQPGSGSAPPRSLGTKGKEFGQMADYDRSGQQGQSGTGQADLGSQAGSTLSGHTDHQEMGEIDQPGSYTGGVSGRQAGTEGEGFILQETDEQDFAREGQGAIENAESTGPSDVERDADRKAKKDSNIEGGVG